MAMTLRLSEKLDADLASVAAAAGMSKQEAVTLAVEEFLERNGHEAQFDEALQRTMTKHADLIEKLAHT